MHELGIAIEAYRLCRERLEPAGGVRLARVWIAVGELSGVEPDCLRFAWQAVTAGGPDERCGLEVEWCPARQVCVACGDVKERAAGSWIPFCPQCASPLRVEGGDELDVIRVEAAPVPQPEGAAR